MELPAKIYCCYCGRWIIYPLKLTWEHLVPLSKGGKDRDNNKRRCCGLCNTWRGNKRLSKFQEEVLQQVGKVRAGYLGVDFTKMADNIEQIIYYTMIHADDLKWPEPNEPEEAVLIINFNYKPPQATPDFDWGQSMATIEKRYGKKKIIAPEPDEVLDKSIRSKPLQNCSVKTFTKLYNELGWPEQAEDVLSRLLAEPEPNFHEF